MVKLSETVKKETLYVALWVIVLSMIMNAVYLIIGHWSLSVLWSTLITGGAGILSFFLLGLTVQAAVEKDPKSAAKKVRASQGLRFLLIFAAALVSISFFDLWAGLIPILFPRIALAFRSFFLKKQNKEDKHE